MGSQITAATNTLALPEAKKLWKALSQKNKKYSLEEIGCEGGASMQYREDGLSKTEVQAQEIPRSSHAFAISALYSGLLKLPKEKKAITDSLDKFFLGDPEQKIPDPNRDYSWAAKLRVNLIPYDLNYTILFIFEKTNILKYLGREFDVSNNVEIMHFPNFQKKYFAEIDAVTPGSDEIQKEIAEIWNRYKIPVQGKQSGVLEESFGGCSHMIATDPTDCSWGWNEFKRMINDLADKSSINKVFIDSRVSFGTFAQEREFADDCDDLIEHIAENACYKEYELSYAKLVAMSWRDREKLRKKWKKPILQEIGDLTFAEGGVAAVKIVIEKDGYRFFLDFEEPEVVEAFSQSKIYKQAEWEIG